MGATYERIFTAGRKQAVIIGILGGLSGWAIMGLFLTALIMLGWLDPFMFD